MSVWKKSFVCFLFVFCSIVSVPLSAGPNSPCILDSTGVAEALPRLLDTAARVGANKELLFQVTENVTRDMAVAGGKQAKDIAFLERAIELSDDLEETGRFRLKQGVGGARYELATGKRLLPGDDLGVDFRDAATGEPLSLKGPFRQDSMKEIPAHAFDLAAFVKDSVKPNTAVKTVIFDLYGLDAAQKQFFKDEVAKQIDPIKIVEYIE